METIFSTQAGPEFGSQISIFLRLAFSVWDGFRRERGSRRGLTQWFSLYVEPSQVESAWGPMLRAGLGVLAVELLIVFLVRRRKASDPSSS